MPELKFTFWRIPVRVQLWFGVLAVLLGTSSGFKDPASLLLFVAIVFGSVFAHELGHAFMGRAFGLQPAIVLHSFGGLTEWIAGRAPGPGRQLLISLAGPSVGLFFGTLLLLGNFALHVLAPDYQLPEPARNLGNAAVFVNIGWSIFNMMPILPLDGGNSLRWFLALLRLKSAEIIARVVSVLVGGTLITLLLLSGSRSILLLLLLGFYVVENGRALALRHRTRGDDALHQKLRESYPLWLAQRDGASMIREGTRARVAAKTPQLAAFATELVAMGQCLEGDARSGLATLSALPPGFPPSLDVALHILDAAGEHAAALELLRRAAETSGDPDLQKRFEEARARAMGT